jgi:hypothetical protein
MPISPNLSNASGNSTVNIQPKVKMFVVQIACTEGYYGLCAVKGLFLSQKLHFKVMLKKTKFWDYKCLFVETD